MRFFKKTLSLLLLSLAAVSAFAAPTANKYAVAVFIPGVMAGSPIYEALAAGVKKAAAENPLITVKIVEGGFNQAQWADQVAALSSNGEYNLIVTSNPALPEICAQVGQDFPQQKFLILDGYLNGHPNIATLFYNNRELSYLHGYFAGLLTAEKKAAPKVGLIVGQEYPVMNKAIRPGVEEGLKAQNPAGTVEFRVVGNWYDATKGSELTQSLISSGTEVFLTIAGSANQGVVTAAKEKGKKVLWYDNNGYAVAKGVVIGSGIIKQELAAFELVRDAAVGKLTFGKARVVGIKDGYVDFITTDPAYISGVSEKNRKAMNDLLAQFKTGKLALAMPLQ